MNTNIVKKIVFRTIHIGLFKFIYKILYSLYIYIFKKITKKLLDVKSIYLKWGLGSKEFIPGLSDLDMIVVINKKSVTKDFFQMKRYINFYFILKKILPFMGYILLLSEKEINSWLTWGDIRACELPFVYTPIYGKKMPIGRYKYIPNKFKIDCISQSYFNNYARLLQLYIKNEFNASDKIMMRNILKFFSDTLKFCHYATEEKFIYYESRKVFLDSFRSTDELLDFLIGEAIQAYNSKFSFNNHEFVPDALACLLVYIDKVCKLHCANLRSEGIPYNDIEVKKIYIDSKYISKELNLFLSGLRNLVNNIPLKLSNYINRIFYSSSYLYIIIKDNIDIKEIRTFLEDFKNLFYNYSQYNNRLAVAVMTESIYSCIRHSLPFSMRYFSIRYHRKKEEELYGDFEKEGLSYWIKPILIEHVYYMRIALTQNNGLLADEHLPSFCFDLLPRLLLAMGKDCIPNTPEGTEAEFRKHYPLLYEQIENLKPISLSSERKKDKGLHLKYYLLADRMLDELVSITEEKYGCG